MCEQICAVACKPINDRVCAYLTACRKNDVCRVRDMVKVDRLVMFEVDHKGQTGLHIALRRGFTDIAVYMILEKGPINKPDNRGIRPIDIAIQNKDIDISHVLWNNIRYYLLLAVIHGR